MQHRAWIIVLIAATGILPGGCAAESRYIYRPSQQATATVSDLPAARYPVPAEKPVGEVLVVSSGVTQLRGTEARTPSLFVRMIVTNNADDAPWVVDTAQQTAFIDGQRQSPASIDVYDQRGPVVQIARGEKRIIDLYYRLPEKLEGADQVPQFDFAWNVQTGARLVAERTAFDRLRVEPVYAGGYYYPYGYRGYPYGYWGPYGYDPFWPHTYVGVHFGYGPRYYGGGSFRGGGFAPGRGGYIRAPAIRR